LHFLHSKGLIHRDLKPENLLIDKDGTLKICDFGWCVQASDDEERGTFCGTLEYMAPEMLKANPNYGKEVDVWALGILLYELMHGTAPFFG
jgi:serine/threonine protein kinase